jgi:hypothetical protein
MKKTLKKTALLQSFRVNNPGQSFGAVFSVILMPFGSLFDSFSGQFFE